MHHCTWPADLSPKNGARYSSRTPPESEAQTTSFIYRYMIIYYDGKTLYFPQYFGHTFLFVS